MPHPALEGPALLGLASFFGLVFVAVFGERIAPHESVYFVVEHGRDPRPYDPGLVYPLGSDVLGRDLFSLVLAGARTTLAIVLVAGLARVTAGVLVVALEGWWHPARFLTGAAAQLLSALPATLIALVLVRILVRADTGVFVVIAALLVTGWAGPYRVIRTELDRLAHASFTQGAVAIGVSRSRLFWRHQFPHLVPVLAMNLSQQVVAALVLVAELGVLGVFVGATRSINIEESLTVVLAGSQNAALLAEPPEWGGLLANARTLESLWTTRWLIFVPGMAFALTAVAVALTGFAFARRYARRDLLEDLHSPATLLIAFVAGAMCVASSVVPERFAAAREWASDARAAVRPTTSSERAFADAGLRSVGPTFAVTRAANEVAQSAPANVTVGAKTLTEPWPRAVERDLSMPLSLRAFLSASTGGGMVEAPLVFVGRGISPSEHPPQPPLRFGLAPQDLGTAIRDYADEYEGIDVRGKVVLMVRFLGISGDVPVGERSRRLGTRGSVPGISVEDSIAGAIRRGAAAVVFVDRDLSAYIYRVGLRSIFGSPTGTAGLDPYLRAERESPLDATSGVPVVILDEASGKTFAAAAGLDLTPFVDCTNWRVCPALDHISSDFYRQSHSRDLGVTARVEVPLARTSVSTTSYVGEVDGVPAETPRVLLWAIREPQASHPPIDVLAAAARVLGPRRTPFIFVDFDPSHNTNANAKAVRDALGGRKISLIVVLTQLDGPALRFTTPNGELTPAFDLYAEKAGARFEITRATAGVAAVAGIAPFFHVRTVVISGAGGHDDLRTDAAALIGYVGGRLALGAEELAR